VTELLAVPALDLRVVSRLRAILRKVTCLFAITARKFIGVLRLIAVLGHVILRVAVAAGPFGDVWALSSR
jgi:hypothetical protein